MKLNQPASNVAILTFTIIRSYPDLYNQLKRIASPEYKALFWYIQGDHFVIQTARKKHCYDLSQFSELKAIYIIDKAIQYLRTKIPLQSTKSITANLSNSQHPP